MQQSLLLFDESVSMVSQGHAPSPAPEVEEIECTDAQPLMFQDEYMGGPSQQVSDDDETQLPTAAAFAIVKTDKEGSGEDWVEDEVLDPTWNQPHAGDPCSSEEEAVVAQSHQHSRRGSRVPKRSVRPLDSTPATAQRSKGPSTPKPGPRSSLAWQFFTQ